MRKYLLPAITAIGIVTFIVAVVSLIINPQKSTDGKIFIATAALVGVTAFLAGLKDTIELLYILFNKAVEEGDSNTSNISLNTGNQSAKYMVNANEVHISDSQEINLDNGTNSHSELQLDQAVFKELTEILPTSSDSIYHLRNHDFGGSFEMTLNRPFYRFLDACERPDFEFLDEELEKLRTDFESKLREFLRLVARETFPTEVNPDWGSVPRAWEITSYLARRYPDATKEEYEQYFNEAEQKIRVTAQRMNTLANEVYEVYEKLIRMGRRKLRV